MNLALLRKEWAQARLNVLGMLGTLSALWLLFIEDRFLFPESYHDQSIALQAGLVVLAGLQLALAQFASESLWKTRDLLVFRACGPASAFRAKCLVGAAATTLFAGGPALVWSVWQYANSPLASAGIWSRVIAYAQVGTLAWAAWGVGALCCQLRHGWGTRVVVLLISGASLLGAAGEASKLLAGAPLWADWLFPIGSAALGVGLAWCAGRAFSVGVDQDVPLRDGHGLALALGIMLATGYTLAVVSSAVTDHLAGKLRLSFAHVVETPEGELALARRDGMILVPVGAERAAFSFKSKLVRVFDPGWMLWGWPEPDGSVHPGTRGQEFGLGGSWDHFSGQGGLSRASAYYESRSRRVHLFVQDPEAPRHEVRDAGCSPNTLIVWSTSEDGMPVSSRVLADLERRTLTLVGVDDGSLSLEPLELPGGDEFRGVERLLTRAWAEVGYRPPFDYEYGLLIAGERGLYRLSKGALEPYERVGDEPFTAAYGPGYWKHGIAAPWPQDDSTIAASDADRLVRLRSRYARYDGLDPTIEVLDAKSGASLFTGRLAPDGARTARLKAAACAASLLQTPIGSIASFANREPWRGGSMFDNLALLGGRRPWLLAACLAFAVCLAWRVRRETRAWGRSPRLGAFWVVVTLCLGLVGWVLFRIAEPRPARAEGRAARRAAAGARTELAPAGASR